MRWLASVFFSLLVLVSLPASAATDDAFHAGSRVYQGRIFQVAELDPAKVALRLYWKDRAGHAYGGLAQLRTALERSGAEFFMATNSGIYARDLTPLGLHIENGKKLHRLNRSHASTGNFFMIPNGVFLLQGDHAAILETDELSRRGSLPPADFAAQSGPLLVRAGKLHPGFKAGSLNRKLRSGVGVDRRGHVFFAISGGPVSFFDFAAFFRDELGCPDALYLDGTISEMMIGDEPAGSQLAPYVGMWAATRKR